MIVEADERKNVWAIHDRGRTFYVTRDMADHAYRSHLAFLVREYRQHCYVANVDVPPEMIPRLPSMRDFLEMLAAERWKRVGMEPVKW